MKNELLRPYFLLILLIGVALLAAHIFEPFLQPLILAVVFAVILQGLHGNVSKIFKGWPSIAALVTVFVSAVFILVPLCIIGIFVAREAGTLYASLNENGAPSLISQLVVQVDTAFGDSIPGVREYSQNISSNIDLYLKQALQWIMQHAGVVFTGISSLVLSLFIFIVALYYLLRDGKRARSMLIELSPLNDKEDVKVFTQLEHAINSIIKGSLTIALIQGIIASIGFTIFGVPNSILWGLVASLAALIPGIGTSLVLIPSVIFLFFTGAVPQAVGLFIWGVVAVGLIDNFLGPKLMGRGTQLHPFLILLSVLGGVMVFGAIGIFLGPLSLCLLFALLSIYSDIVKGTNAA